VQLRRAILKASGSQLAMELHLAEQSQTDRTGTGEALSPLSRHRSAGDLASTSSSSEPTAQLFKELDASDVHYRERLAALKRFNSKSKATTKQLSLKVEWIKEHQQLRSVVHSTERDIGSLLEVMVLSSPSDSLIQSLVDESFRYARERQVNENELISHVSDLKGLFKDTAKALASGRRGKVATKSDEEALASASSSSHPPAVSIFADVLMQVRLSQTEKMGFMSMEEAQLSAEVGLLHRLVVSMLRQDRLEQQNEAFRSQLRPEVGDDDEVALVLEEWYAKLEVLDRAHAAELALLNEERLQLGDSGGGGRGGGLGGEWAEKDLLTFGKIYSNFQKTGKSRKVFLAQLASQLAHVPQAELETHETWHRACQALGQKKKILVSGHETARIKLIDQAKIQVDSFRARRAESRLAALKLSMHETARQQLHHVLETLRAARAESDALFHSKKQAEESEQAEEAQRAAAALKAEHEWKKQQVEMYKQVRNQMQEHLHREEERIREEARLAQLAAVEANRERVEARDQARIAKEEDKRKKELQHLENERSKMDTLMRLAAQVPYYENIQNAASKLDHVTAAAHAHEYLGGQEQFRGFMRPTGFTDNKIVADARFRLAAALRSAAPGLIHTGPARMAIAQFHPRPHLAVHGILSATGGGGGVI